MLRERGFQGVPARVCSLFVGRDEVLALAVRRWESAREGSGHLLLVAGDAGIGKSRLFGEIAEGVEPGTRVIRVAAFPSDAEVAGGVLLELSDELRRTGRPGQGHSGQTHPDRALLLRERLLSDGGVGEDAALKRRVLVGDLADILSDLVHEQPTLFLIEDLHWVDELSFDVFNRLALALGDAPSMVVASYRTDELYPRTPLSRWRAHLLGQRFAEEVRLTRLGQEDTGRMVEAITGAVPSSGYLESLQARSDGIPLHIEELIAGDSSSALPGTVAEALAGRVAMLGVETQSIVGAASVIGRSFDIDLLGAITEESVQAIDDALQELAERHIVLARDDGVGFDFRHALIRDAVYDGIPPHRKRALHSAVARAAQAAGFSDAYLSAQFERANEPGPAYEHALAAALDAVRVSAHREAAALYERAVRTAPPQLLPAARATLHARFAAELAAIDDNERAAAQLTTAIELFDELGDVVSACALAPRLIAALHLLGIDLETRTTLARTAIARLDALPDAPSDILSEINPRHVRADLLGALSAAYMLDRRLDEAIRYGREAAALATDPDALGERTNIDVTLASALVFAGHAEEGWQLFESAVADGEASGLESGTARAFRMMGSTASVTVDYERAGRWISSGLAYTARTEQWNDHHYLTAHLAHVQWAEGDWDAAERTARRALADGRGGITTRITVLHVLGYLALGRNQPAVANQHLREALAIGEQMGELQRFSPALWGLAELALHEGNPQLCVELCERGYRASARIGDAAYLFPYLVTGARARLALRDLGAARDWTARCAGLLRERGIPGTLSAIDHAEGLIELADGHTGKSRALLERASEGWMSRRRHWESVQALTDLARCATRSRRPAEAARLAGQAREFARASGATLLESAVTAIGAGRSADTGASPLTAREFEVARLVASGGTNKHIAQELAVSPRTVSAHVEHILAKLGAGRRAEIAAWVTAAAHDRE